MFKKVLTKKGWKEKGAINVIIYYISGQISSLIEFLSMNDILLYYNMLYFYAKTVKHLVNLLG